MQNYLKPKKVMTFQEQIEIFSYRSEMNYMSLKYLEPKENMCMHQRIKQ